MSTEINKPKKISQSLADKAADFIVDSLVKRPEIPDGEKLAVLTDAQKQQLQEIEERAIVSPDGLIDEVEAAIGMLRIGHHFGWKVLYIVHSKKTIRKYEDILGIKIRDIFPEKGPSAPRSKGLALAEKYPNFWKVVSGDIKITNRREIE